MDSRNLVVILFLFLISCDELSCRFNKVPEAPYPNPDRVEEFKTNIINIASIHATNTSENISAYASSKSAIVGLTRNMAIDLAKFGIRVNSISPGAVNTHMLRSHLSKEKLKTLENSHLLKKIGEPIQIAKTCLFINKNKFFNGNNIVIDGGVTCQLSSE